MYRRSVVPEVLGKDGGGGEDDVGASDDEV